MLFTINLTIYVIFFLLLSPEPSYLDKISRIFPKVSRAFVQDWLHSCFVIDQVISDQPFCLLFVRVVSSRLYQEDGQHNQD